MKRALTKSQASELLRAASLLPLASRDAFLDAVDKQLCRVPHHHVSNRDVSAAISNALNVTTTHFMCDSAEGAQVMAKKNYKLYSLITGERIEDDDSDVMPPNTRMVVPMMARDGMSEMQKSVVDVKMARDAAKRFGLNDALDLHRPGQRFADADARAHVEEVYQDEKRKLQDAWRQPVTDVRGQQEGDVCTVNGAAGHLRKVGNKFECVPDKRQDSAPHTMTMDEAQRIRDRAWLESVQELEGAWRR